MWYFINTLHMNIIPHNLFLFLWLQVLCTFLCPSKPSCPFILPVPRAWLEWATGHKRDSPALWVHSVRSTRRDQRGEAELGKVIYSIPATLWDYWGVWDSGQAVPSWDNNAPPLLQSENPVPPLQFTYLCKIHKITLPF